MDDYLTNVSDKLKKYIFANCRKNKSFNNFFKLCIKYKVVIVKDNKFIDIKFILDNIKEVKNYFVKKLGIFIIKKCSNIENPIDMINQKLEVLEKNLKNIDNLIFLVNYFIENNLVNNFFSYNINLKINKSDKGNNKKLLKINKNFRSNNNETIINKIRYNNCNDNSNLKKLKQSSLFLSSDNISDNNNKACSIINNSNYIAEYSN